MLRASIPAQPGLGGPGPGGGALRSELEDREVRGAGLGGEVGVYRAGRRGLFMGSPAYIRGNLRQYEEAHMDAVLFFIQCGNRKHADIMESLELFAREVMPEFKDRHVRHQQWRAQQLDGVRFPINSSI